MVAPLLIETVTQFQQEKQLLSQKKLVLFEIQHLIIVVQITHMGKKLYGGGGGFFL